VRDTNELGGLTEFGACPGCSDFGHRLAPSYQCACIGCTPAPASMAPIRRQHRLVEQDLPPVMCTSAPPPRHGEFYQVALHQFGGRHCFPDAVAPHRGGEGQPRFKAARWLELGSPENPEAALKIRRKAMIARLDIFVENQLQADCSL